MRSRSRRTPAGMPVTMIVSCGPCDSPAEVKVKRMAQDKLARHVSHPGQARSFRDHHLRPDDVSRVRGRRWVLRANSAATASRTTPRRRWSWPPRSAGSSARRSTTPSSFTTGICFHARGAGLVRRADRRLPRMHALSARAAHHVPQRRRRRRARAGHRLLPRPHRLLPGRRRLRPPDQLLGGHRLSEGIAADHGRGAAQLRRARRSVDPPRPGPARAPDAALRVRRRAGDVLHPVARRPRAAPQRSHLRPLPRADGHRALPRRDRPRQGRPLPRAVHHRAVDQRDSGRDRDGVDPEAEGRRIFRTPAG